LAESPFEPSPLVGRFSEPEPSYSGQFNSQRSINFQYTNCCCSGVAIRFSPYNARTHKASISSLQKLTTETPERAKSLEAISVCSVRAAPFAVKPPKITDEANLCATSSYDRCYEISAMFRQCLMTHSLGRNKLLKQKASARLTDSFSLDYNSRYDFADQPYRE